MRTGRGFTLVEITIASFMALLVSAALIRVFIFGRNVEREARSSYLIREDADVAFRRLQEELRLTHLASIRLAEDDNGFGMASPLQDNDLTSFELTRFGVAKWKNWVHFGVSANDVNTGTLVRWEVPYNENATLPLPPQSMDSAPSGAKWTLLSNVVLAGRGPVATTDGESLEMGNVAGGGGLQLRFLRREEGAEVLSKVNPSQKSDGTEDGWSAGSTALVDCKLQVADVSGESGKLSLYTLNLRVKPRN